MIQPAKIAFDTSALISGYREHSTRGIGRYVKNLKNYFEKYHVDIQNEFQIEYFDYNVVFAGSKIKKAIDLLPRGRETIGRQLFYPYKLKKLRPTLYHFPAHMDPPALACGKYIITILDLILFILKDLYKTEQVEWKYNFARWLEKKAILGAAHYLAISAHTAHDLEREFGVPPEKITVTPLGVEKCFLEWGQRELSLEERSAVYSKLGLETDIPYFTYMGGIDLRKNLVTLIKALKILHDQLNSDVRKPKLLLIGNISENHQSYPALTKVIYEQGLENFVVKTGFIADEELPKFLKCSVAFVFPSLYEGFGMPPLEAMACGVPTIAARASCLPEILGTAALMVEPTDALEMANAMLAFMGKKDLRNRYAELGWRQAKQYTWERTGELTLAGYRKALAEGRR
ncbi:MAG TPA: glycosyltransferase family 1 protein [Oligoflexia bacterium]|nr:glycosyltransferase family 1 protein [Oligoflexia bacterium]HMP26427.1 glycosyltransferase family 1 protein [Oligoflexia bacterium]